MSPTDTNPPSNLLCPISKQLMTDPVVSIHGNSFQREAIVSWLHKNDCCPLTRNPLSFEDLISDHRLLVRVQCWQDENGVQDQDQGLDISLHHADENEEEDNEDFLVKKLGLVVDPSDKPSDVDDYGFYEDIETTSPPMEIVIPSDTSSENNAKPTRNPVKRILRVFSKGSRVNSMQ